MILALILAFFLLWTPAAWGQNVSLRPDAQTGTTVQAVCPAAPAALVLASNTRRRSFSIVALRANTGNVYIGFVSTVLTTTGQELQAGGALNDSSYIGAVYCVSAAGGQNVSVAETAR